NLSRVNHLAPAAPGGPTSPATHCAPLPPSVLPAAHGSWPDLRAWIGAASGPVYPVSLPHGLCLRGEPWHLWNREQDSGSGETGRKTNLKKEKEVLAGKSILTTTEEEQEHQEGKKPLGQTQYKRILLFPHFQSCEALAEGREQIISSQERIEARDSEDKPVQSGYHKHLNGNDRNRKMRRALKACQECLQELQEVRELISLLHSPSCPRQYLAPSVFCSYLRIHPEKGSCHQSLGQDPPGKIWEAASARAHQPPGKCAKDAVPAVSLSASPTSLTSTNSPASLFSSFTVSSQSSLNVSEIAEPSHPPECLSFQPPAFSPPPSTPPDSETWPPSPKVASSCPYANTTPQADSKAFPMRPAPYSSSTAWPPSSVRTISGLGRATDPVSSESWWQTTAKALKLSSSSQPKSQPEPLSSPSPKDSFWEDTRNQRVEISSPPLISPDIQELMEVLISNRVELKIWKKNEEVKVSESSLGNISKAVFTSRQSWVSDVSQPRKTNQSGCWVLKSPHVLTFQGATFRRNEGTGSPKIYCSVLLKRLSNVFFAQIQAKAVSRLSLVQPLSPVTQPQHVTPPGTQLWAPPQAQDQTQAQFSFSSPIPYLSPASQISNPRLRPLSVLPKDLSSPRYQENWSYLFRRKSPKDGLACPKNQATVNLRQTEDKHPGVCWTQSRQRCFMVLSVYRPKQLAHTEDGIQVPMRYFTREVYEQKPGGWCEENPNSSLHWPSKIPSECSGKKLWGLKKDDSEALSQGHTEAWIKHPESPFGQEVGAEYPSWQPARSCTFPELTRNLDIWSPPLARYPTRMPPWSCAWPAHSKHAGSTYNKALGEAQVKLAPQNTQVLQSLQAEKGSTLTLSTVCPLQLSHLCIGGWLKRQLVMSLGNSSPRKFGRECGSKNVSPQPQ
ncbi:LOW QUALITY PROTEIN: Spermatogenesis-associated protein 31E1, partial [Galemys pyrenaicus]